jgi:hypothetical protein
MNHWGTVLVFGATLLCAQSGSLQGSVYHFNSLSFADEVWINNKAPFKSPVKANVEFVTPGAVDWVFADNTGKEIRTLRDRNESGGWISMNFASLGLSGDYSVGFRNASPGKKEIKQGDVFLKVD